MNRILNFLSILSVLAVCLKYYMAGAIGSGVVLGILVLAAVLIALNSPVWHFVKAALILISFVTMLSGYAFDANDLGSLVGLMITVILCVAVIAFLIRRVFGLGSNGEEEHFIYNRRTRKLKRKGW